MVLFLHTRSKLSAFCNQNVQDPNGFCFSLRRLGPFSNRREKTTTVDGTISLLASILKFDDLFTRQAPIRAYVISKQQEKVREVHYIDSLQ